MNCFILLGGNAHIPLNWPPTKTPTIDLIYEWGPWLNYHWWMLHVEQRQMPGGLLEWGVLNYWTTFIVFEANCALINWEQGLELVVLGSWEVPVAPATSWRLVCVLLPLVLWGHLFRVALCWEKWCLPALCPGNGFSLSPGAASAVELPWLLGGVLQNPTLLGLSTALQADVAHQPQLSPAAPSTLLCPMYWAHSVRIAARTAFAWSCSLQVLLSHQSHWVLFCLWQKACC